MCLVRSQLSCARRSASNTAERIASNRSLARVDGAATGAAPSHASPAATRAAAWPWAGCAWLGAEAVRVPPSPRPKWRSSAKACLGSGRWPLAAACAAANAVLARGAGKRGGANAHACGLPCFRDNCDVECDGAGCPCVAGGLRGTMAAPIAPVDVPCLVRMGAERGRYNGAGRAVEPRACADFGLPSAASAGVRAAATLARAGGAADCCRPTMVGAGRDEDALLNASALGGSDFPSLSLIFSRSSRDAGRSAGRWKPSRGIVLSSSLLRLAVELHAMGCSEDDRTVKPSYI